MTNSRTQYLIVEVQGENKTTGPGRKALARHLRLNLQPTTTMMMVAVMMIFYAHLVGG